MAGGIPDGELFGGNFRGEVGGRFGGEAPAHEIFRDAAGEEEILQIIASPGLGAGAGHFEAAKGLTGDKGSGSAAVDVEIADQELGLDALNVGGATGEKSTREGVLGIVGKSERFVEVFGMED